MEREYDLLMRGGIVMPMVDDEEWFSGDVLIEDGRIARVVRGSVGPGVAVRRTVDCSNAVVLPGFVQCHVHVVQSLLRHQADGVDLIQWLGGHTWPYEAALDGDGAETAAELGIAELLTGGTTTALDFGTCHHHDRVFRAAERLGIRLVSGKTHMDIGDGVPPALIEDRDRSLADAAELGKRWHGAAGGRLGYAVAPRFALSCSPELLRGCAELARSQGWLLQSHASENVDEVAAVKAITGLTNIRYLDQVGLTGEDVVLAHGVHLEQEEVEILAATRTRICHCPGANLKLGSGIADLPRLRRAGVVLALGADGAPCNNRLSIFHEMSLAATLHSLRHGPTVITAGQVLAMATRDGAAALHLSGEVGTLEPGKAADIAVIDLGGWSLRPGGHPASRIVFGASARDVRHVLVGGETVVLDGHLQTVDEAEAGARIDEAWRATTARMDRSG